MVISGMTKPLKAVLERAGTYRATREELMKIDEALAAVRRGEIASADEFEAVFAKHR